MVDLKLELRYDFAFKILVGNFFCKKLKFIDKSLNVSEIVESTFMYKKFIMKSIYARQTKEEF